MYEVGILGDDDKVKAKFFCFMCSLQTNVSSDIIGLERGTYE